MQPRLISGESVQEVFLLFINKSGRSADIFWINYNGEQKYFGTIEPGAQKKINTFSNHPWVFRSKITGEKLHIENKDILWQLQAFIMAEQLDVSFVFTSR
uniref:von Hippel-Lindau disease tumour suppressor beta domain-containing protein n=1 Tax=Megaselia scalaris TaxID=36166 RepID=T1GR73_MEGSC